MADNPFTPGFGSSPPVLAGRDDLVAMVGEALDSHAGHPARSTLYIGARGTGKTAMLNAAQDEARQRGWLVISEDASRGFARRLVRTQLPAALEQLAPPQTRHHLEGLTTPVGGATWKQTTETGYGFEHNLRTLLTALCDRCAEHGTGVMITVDEIHARTVNLDELDEFANVVQHAIREGPPLAVAVAGLPAATHRRLLAADAERPITFFRRADRHELGPIAPLEVEEAIYQPITDHGKTIDDEALLIAAQATRGYPFMIQLVGFQMWRHVGGNSRIDIDVARHGVTAAARRIGQLVHAPAMSDLSATDQRFLAAMAIDDGPSAIGAVAQRLGTDGNNANQYRHRLILADMIVEAGHGRIDYKLPYMREYLRSIQPTVDIGRPAVDWRGDVPPPGSSGIEL
jgi:hypothetical protein